MVRTPVTMTVAVTILWSGHYDSSRMLLWSGHYDSSCDDTVVRAL